MEIPGGSGKAEPDTQVGEQGWAHLCGAAMEGVGQLTEEICLVTYVQVEHSQCCTRIATI